MSTIQICILVQNFRISILGQKEQEIESQIEEVIDYLPSLFNILDAIREEEDAEKLKRVEADQEVIPILILNISP